MMLRCSSGLEIVPCVSAYGLAMVSCLFSVAQAVCLRLEGLGIHYCLGFVVRGLR